MAKAKKLKSGNWRCQVYVGRQKYFDKNGNEKEKIIRKSFTAPTKKEAEYLAKSYEMERIQNGASGSNMLLRNAYKEYIESRESVLSPSTIKGYKSLYKNNLQCIMDIRVSDLTQEDIQRAINLEVKNHTPKTVRNIHGLLSAVLSVYRPNFALNTSLPQKVRPKLHIPTDEEIKTLLDAVQGTEMELPVLLGAFGTMRRGEICALLKSDLKGNVIHVQRAMVSNANNEWVIKAPKSYAGNRYIELPDFIVKKFDDREETIINLNPNQITERFERILKRNSIPHFRFHDLRHYSASIMHAIGIPDSYIMQRGGWSSDTVLKTVYRHTLADREKEMSQKANDYFSEISAHESSHKK